MRTTSIQGCTLQYPDEIGFAFNPCLFVAKASRSKPISRMGVQITDSYKFHTIYSEAFSDGAYIDIREYVQAMFDNSNEVLSYANKTANKSKLGRDVAITVTIDFKDDTTATFDTSVFYVWAALQAGGTDVYNGFRTLTYFKGYPFTIGIFTADKGGLLFKRDGVATDNIELPSKGVYNVSMPTGINARRYIIVSDWDGKFLATTFDNTFDMTFRYSTGSRYSDKVRINMADDDYNGSESVYLRWINRHGVYCYWLFKKGSESIKTANSGDFVRNNLLSYDQTYGYQNGTGRQMGYTRKDTLPLCAPLVDSYTWDFLLDLCTSPVVDMFCGWNDDAHTQAHWLSVSVVAGTITKAVDVLQDFILQINLPETPIQSL